MFRRNKNSYKIVAICTNGNKKGKYTFTEDDDENWDTIAEKMFYDEFGVNPTEMEVKSRKKI